MFRSRTWRTAGLVLTDHRFEAPLDHQRPERGRIEVFAREVVSPSKAEAALPWLVFLQGGPGFEAPRPLTRSGWLRRALEDYRVLLVDQRGTGRSTPVSPRTLARLSSPAEQAEWLAHFRADAIVADCELIRRELLGREERWSVLGQSFGGFCATRYLCAAPEGLREVFIAGGLPSVDAPAEEVYRRTFPIVRDRNRAHFERFPDDRELLDEVAAVLRRRAVRLPCGDPLTVRWLQLLGLRLGMSDGSDSLHYLLEDAFVRGPEGPELSYKFLRGVENGLQYDTNPLFAILHEAIYAQEAATCWAAERVRAEFPEFSPDAERVLFTGEMIFPWMFEDNAALRPLAATAEIVARRADWPRLYDADALAANDVPAAAVVYRDDMYVPRDLSMETAGRIAGLRVWETNELEHNGIRAEGERVLGRLIDMVRGEV